jgi:hypothetical protein
MNGSKPNGPSADPQTSGGVPTRFTLRASPFPSPLPSPLGSTAIEISPVAQPHGQAPNLNPNRNLARLRFLEIRSKITIKSERKPFRLNSTAVPSGRGRILRCPSAQPQHCVCQTNFPNNRTCRRLFPLPVGEGQGNRLAVRPSDSDPSRNCRTSRVLRQSRRFPMTMIHSRLAPVLASSIRVNSRNSRIKLL